MLYGPLETEENEDEFEEVESISQISNITNADIRRQWYLFKTMIHQKNCENMIEVLDVMDRALFLDTHQNPHQTSIVDFFHIISQDITQKSETRATIEVVIVDDDDDDDMEDDIEVRNEIV